MIPGEPEYTQAHSERSARIVEEWIREQGADQELTREVARLIEQHETGGDAAANLLQAADSLSFLEVNADLVAAWAETGRCSVERAKRQHEWMFNRIRPKHARQLAEPLFASAFKRLDDHAA
jgi:hypothetical protein